MEQSPMTTKRALLVLGVTIFLLALTLVAPSKWVGGTSTKNTPETRKKIIFKTRDELLALNNDKNKNQVPDWKDIVSASVSDDLRTKASQANPTKEDLAILNDPNNYTSSFAKNIFTASAYLGQKGNELTVKDQTELVSNLITKEAGRESAKEYTFNDLTVTKDTSSSAKVAYGNALGTSLKKLNEMNAKGGDLDILKEYSEKKDPKLLHTFSEKKAMLDGMIKELVAIKVPLSASIYHLMLINAFSKYSFVLDALSKIGTDPLRGLVGTQNHESVIMGLLTSVNNISAYFSYEKVTFTKKDPGYIFIK